MKQMKQLIVGMKAEDNPAFSVIVLHTYIQYQNKFFSQILQARRPGCISIKLAMFI